MKKMTATSSTKFQGKTYRELEQAKNDRETKTCGNCGKSTELKPLFQYMNRQTLVIVNWVCCE